MNYTTNEKTAAEYRKLANYHIRKIIERDEFVTPKTIENYMREIATTVCKTTWRKIKRAMIFTQSESKFHDAAARLSALHFPSDAKPKPKPKRGKKISDNDFSELEKHFQKSDKLVWSYLILCKYTGCRPSEVANIELDEFDGIHITSSKKRFDRGLDRLILLDGNNKEKIRKAVNILSKIPDGEKSNLHNLARMRLARFVDKNFKRKSITLYTLRHQLGADLKSSAMPANVRSAIMGHRSTDSIQVYGNSKSGSAVKIKVSKDAVDAVTIAKPREMQMHDNSKSEQSFLLTT